MAHTITNIGPFYYWVLVVAVVDTKGIGVRTAKLFFFDSFVVFVLVFPFTKVPD
jgi:hypothetical protein